VRLNREMYTNDLHDALLKKNSLAFWKCWGSKFNCIARCKLVEGCTDAEVIVNKFAYHFSSVFFCNNPP